MHLASRPARGPSHPQSFCLPCRVHMKRSLHLDFSGNAVFYAACSLPVILKNSCSKLHYQKGFNSILVSYEIVERKAVRQGQPTLALSHTGATLEAAQGKIMSQSPTDATSLRWHLYSSWLKKPSICPWVASRVESPEEFLSSLPMVERTALRCRQPTLALSHKGVPRSQENANPPRTLLGPSA